MGHAVPLHAPCTKPVIHLSFTTIRFLAKSKLSFSTLRSAKCWRILTTWKTRHQVIPQSIYERDGQVDTTSDILWWTMRNIRIAWAQLSKQIITNEFPNVLNARNFMTFAANGMQNSVVWSTKTRWTVWKQEFSAEEEHSVTAIPDRHLSTSNLAEKVNRSTSFSIADKASKLLLFVTLFIQWRLCIICTRRLQSQGFNQTDIERALNSTKTLENAWTVNLRRRFAKQFWWWTFSSKSVDCTEQDQHCWPFRTTVYILYSSSSNILRKMVHSIFREERRMSLTTLYRWVMI